MPFADFLATAGSGSVVGNVAEAFGGRTPRQRGVDALNAEIPAIYEAFDRATTRAEIEAATRKFTEAWGRTGGPMDERFDKFAEKLTKAALNRVQGQELESIRRDYGQQTTPLTPQVAPQGQGQPFDLGTSFTPQTTPERPLDAEGARRYFEATGASPQHFQSIMETPSKITENVAQARSHAATGGQKEYELSQQRRLENIQLPGSAGEAGITAGMMAVPHGAPVASYMSQLNPQREPSGAALDLKRQGLDIQQQRLQVLADRVASGSATAAERQELARQKLELDRARFELQKLGTDTEREGQLSGVDTEVYLNAIREEAIRTGKTSPQDLQVLAAKRGLILEGEPTIESTGGVSILGLPAIGAEKSLGGPGVRLRRAPTVTTKRPGQTPGSAAPPAGGGTVLMRAPDGSQRQVPADRVEEFKKKGATVVGGR